MSVITFGQNAASAEAFHTCNVVLLYEDSAAQRKAIEFCDRLWTRFDQELDFALNHWSFEALEDFLIAPRAADALAHADIVLVSTHGADLPAATARWLESSMEMRTKLEGVLACVIVEPVNARDGGEMLLHRLRQIAFGLNMDFLPPAPLPGERSTAPNWPLPQIETRDQIGNSHWGLNE